MSNDAIVKLKIFKCFGLASILLNLTPISVQTVTQGRFIEAKANVTSRMLSMELTTEYRVNAVRVSVHALGLIH